MGFVYCLVRLHSKFAESEIEFIAVSCGLRWRRAGRAGALVRVHMRALHSINYPLLKFFGLGLKMV